MKSLLPMIPFVAAFALLACQGSDGPVAEGVAAVPDSAFGKPRNAAAAEARARAAVPAVGNGMGWSSSRNGTVASFGPIGAASMLTFACQFEGGQRRLEVTRLSPAHDGATATLSFTGSGHASSMPMRGIAKPGGPGESEWRGEARGDMARAVARAFSGDGQVNVTLGGAPALAVPTSPLASKLLRRCA
jgi:hypothetical protein